MNITLESDRTIAVTVYMLFTDGDMYTITLPLDGYGPTTFTIVGRWPKDLVDLEIQYEGYRFGYPIELDASGEHLKTITISGRRDQWSQLLRDKAMEKTHD